MDQKIIFIGATGYETYCSQGRSALLDQGCLLLENRKSSPYNREELLELAPSISGVISGCEVWDEETISAAPHLNVIVKFGTGVDNIDLQAAKRHGVQVANCPGLNSVSVAEHTFALVLACLRKVPSLDRSVREGQWERCVFPEISDAIWGVLGFGAAGREVAARAKAFGARVLAYDKFPNETAAQALGVQMDSLEKVLAQADILTIHLPALPETVHLINRERIQLMKPGAVAVNTARGVVVDEEAVAEALSNGALSAYGSDVYEREPVESISPLLTCPNTVLSPHLAGESINSYAKIGAVAAQSVLAVLSGGELPHRLV